MAFRLEYVLFYQFYAKITTFFDPEKFGTAPLLYVDVETFGGNWRENDIKTSKSSYRRHTRESSYIPRVRRHFLAPIGFTEIPVGYARIMLFVNIYFIVRLVSILKYFHTIPFLTVYCDFYLTENSDIIVLCKLYSTSCQPLTCHWDKILCPCPINSSHWVKISVQVYKFQWLAHQSLTTGTVNFTWHCSRSNENHNNTNGIFLRRCFH